jgi:glucose/arabinose dehydrogenase
MTLMPRHALFASAGLTILLAASAVAQQAQPPAAAPGRPPGTEHIVLPVNPPPRLTVTQPDQIPINRLRVPQGFQVELWAHGMPGARMMTRADNGTIFVGTRTIGRVYALTDSGGQRSSRIIVQGLTQPNGVTFRNGSLYVAAINRVLRFDGIEQSLASPPQPVDLSAAFNLPPEVHHGWKFLAFGPDGKLYVPVGVPCNICEIDENRHGVILRFNPDGTGREVVARGVRNSVGFDFHPVTRQLWFTDNGRDWAGDDGFEEELNVVTRNGEHFGFPWCHQGDMPDPEFRGRACNEFTPPVARLGPHAAALGMRFYTGAMFPAAYRERAFIARRGSWNRTVRFGYDVVTATTTPGQPVRIEPFLTGFLENGEFWGRPVDVMQLPDGSLLVSDEQNGAIYRISYRG